MQVGQLYSCKWRNRSYNTDCLYEERGWDMLMFLRLDRHYYHFYDILRGSKCVLDEGLIKHCKEITTEEKCTK
jgi:hypothetical protein